MVLPVSVLAVFLCLASCSSESDNSPALDASLADSGLDVDTANLPVDGSIGQSDAISQGPDADISMLCAEPGSVGNSMGVGNGRRTPSHFVLGH